MTNTNDSMDPMVLTHNLMEIQRGAEEKLNKLKDAILVELSQQVKTEPRGLDPPRRYSSAPYVTRCASAL